MGDGQFGIDVDTVDRIARDVKEAADIGVQLCMVVGGGNIFRGLAGSAKGIDRATADYMGMLATVMNALALQAGLERAGLSCRVQSAIAMNNVCEPYVRRRAIRHMEKGRVVIFAAGTGNPLLHHRHGGRPAGGRDELRRHDEGDPGGRCLQRRPQKGPRRQPL